jgi:hypothetical protein
VVVGVDPGFFERRPHHVGPVRLVAGEDLAQPLPRHEHPPSAEPEVGAVMRLVLAVPRHHPRQGGLGLDPGPEPVRARRRAGQPADFFGQPVDVCSPSWRHLAVRIVRLSDRLGQVLAQVPGLPHALR